MLACSLLMHQVDSGVSELAARSLAFLEKTGGDTSNAAAEAKNLAAEMAAAAAKLPMVERLLDPAEVVIAGPPNAGKSSLVNALVGRDVCIVTDVPGTTRDWVRELADIGGAALWLTDTAGIWNIELSAGDGHAAIDAEAVKRAWSRIDQADLVLAVMDAANPPDASEPHWARLLSEKNIIRVANKVDKTAAQPGFVGVSAATRAGLDELKAEILRRLGLEGLSADLAAAFTPRQARLLENAALAIQTDPAAASAHLAELLGSGQGT